MIIRRSETLFKYCDLNTGSPPIPIFCLRTLMGDKSVTLDTRELRAVLEEVPLNSYEVLKFIEETLRKEENI